MARVLLTGGRGLLSVELVPRLVGAGYTTRVMSRAAARGDEDFSIEWAQANLTQGTGIAEALRDVEIVIHTASSPIHHSYGVDVRGTQNLLQAAYNAGVAHIVYISSVGADRIDHPYYSNRLAAEQAIIYSGLPYTIIRTTPTHHLLDRYLRMARRLAWLPALPLPSDFRLQPVDTGDIADYVMAQLGTRPAGLLDGFGGPEVLGGDDIAHLWLAAQGIDRPLKRLPVPGALARALRDGLNTLPARKIGLTTWASWVEDMYGPQPAMQYHATLRNVMAHG